MKILIFILTLILLAMSAITALGFMFLIWGTSHDSAIVMFMVLSNVAPLFTSFFLIEVLGWSGLLFVAIGGTFLFRGHPGKSVGFQLLALVVFLAASIVAFSTGYSAKVESAPLVIRAMKKFDIYYYFYYPLTATFVFAVLVICLLLSRRRPALPTSSSQES
jgi:hypothetical protein